MIKIPSLNVLLSRQLYERDKALIKSKLCYNNIFHIVEREIHRFVSGQWKVAYGYVGVTEEIYCRHAFIWSKTDGVIDPTEFAVKDRIRSTRPYYIVKIFSLEEYIAAISAENGYPALNMYLYKNDSAAQEWALANGLFFIG